MKNVTELVLNDDIIETVDGLLNLQVGDLFYFSIRGTTPRSEKTYLEENSEYKESFLNEIIDSKNEKASKYHIKYFRVLKIFKSYSLEYSLSISEPSRTFTETIKVEEVK